MHLENGDICLIETGARMHGGKGPYVAALNRQYTQVNLQYDVFLNNAQVWQQLYDGTLKNPLSRHAIEVDLCSPVEGWLKKSLENEEIMSLPSF